MSNEQVIVEVGAEDNASQKLENVAKTTEGFGDRIKNSLKEAEGASKAFAASLAVAGAALAAVAVVSINAAREQIAADNQLAAVLKSTKNAVGLTADEIKRMADGLSKVTNFSDDTIQSGQNMLLTFTKIGKDVFPDATETMLNMAQAMGGDVKNTAIQLGKALNDPIQGVNALKRVGVQLTDEQTKMVAKFMEAGDVASAQKVILNELATEFGGVARAVADPITMLKNEIGNMAEAIGFKLMPYVTAVTTAFFAWLDSMGGADAVIDNVFAALEAVAPYFPLIAGAIIGGLVPALYASAAAFLANVVALAPFMAAGAAIAAIAYLIYEAYNTNFLGFRDIVTSVMAALMPILMQFRDFIVLLTTEIPAALQLISFAWKKNMYGIQTIVTTVWAIISTLFKTTFDTIVGLFKVFAGIITGDWSLMWEGVKQIASAGGELLSKAWSGIMSGISTVASSIWEGIKAVFVSGINWIIDKMNAFIRSLSTVTGAVGKAVGVKNWSISEIPHLASGGIVTRPTIAMIGEAGPEAVVPLGKGRGTGVGGINITVSGNSFYGDDKEFALKIGDAIMKKVIPHLSFRTA